jgi:hypothetical protein
MCSASSITRVVGRDHEVAVQREVAAARDAVAVHLRDHRDAAVPDLAPEVPVRRGERDVLLDRAGRDVRALLLGGVDVVARAERRTRAAQHDHARLAVRLRVAHRIDDLALQCGVQRVALLGAVERDALHVPDALDGDGLVLACGHARSPPAPSDGDVRRMVYL